MAADTWGAGGSIVASRIPSGFNWQSYVDANPDLKQAGIDTENEALRHYSMFGFAEGRPGATPVANIDTWARNTPINESRIPSGFSWRDYLGANPDLSGVGIDTEGEARRHYALYGYAENRPGVPQTTNEQGFTQKQVDDFRAAMLRKDFTAAANIAKSVGASSKDVTDFINSNPSSFGLPSKISKQDVDAFFAQPTTTTTPTTTTPTTTAPAVTTVTDYQGRTYDRNVILNLARQIVPYIGTLKGGIFGTKKQSVGFSFEEGTKILGQEPTSAEQVLFDMARNLVKQGITDISKLSLRPTTEDLVAREYFDDNGVRRYFLLIPTGDAENSITRQVTADELKNATQRTIDYGEGPVRELLVRNVQTGTSLYFGDRLIQSTYGGPENISLRIGETYSGPGMTGYVLRFNPATGGPQFNTFGEDTGQGQLISTVLTFASFIPGAQPFAAVAAAALAADRGDVLGALTALAGINGPSNVSTALQVANAIEKGNWAGAISALMNNPDLGPSIGGVKLDGNITIKDIGNAVSIGIALNKNDIAGALAAASALTKSTDLQTASSAVAIVKALQSGNIAAAVNAVKGLDRAITAAEKINDSKVVSSVIDASSDLGQLEPEVEDEIITAIKESGADQSTINVSAPVDEEVIRMPETETAVTQPPVEIAAVDTGTKTDVTAPTTGTIVDSQPTTPESPGTLPTIVVTPEGSYIELEELFTPPNVYEAVKNIRQLFSYGTPGEVPEDAIYFALFGTGGTGQDERFKLITFESPQERAEALKIIKYVIDNPQTPENERNLAQIAFDNIAEIPSTFEIENNIPVVVETVATPGGGGGGGGGMPAGETFAPGGATKPAVTTGTDSAPDLSSVEAEIARLLLEESRPVQTGDVGQISIRPGGVTGEVTPSQDTGGTRTEDVTDVIGGADTKGQGTTVSEGTGEGAGPGTGTGTGTGEGAGAGEGLGSGQGPGAGEGTGGGVGEGGEEATTNIEDEIIKIVEDSINIPSSRETPQDRFTTTLSPRITGEALASILGEKEPLFGGDEDKQRAVWNRRSLRLRRALGL